MEWLNLFVNIAVAVGTIGASVVALWLAIRDNHVQINGVFVWGIPTDYQPKLLLQNLGNRIAVIKSVEIKYKRKKINTIDFFGQYELKNKAIVLANSCMEIPIPSEWLKFDEVKNREKRYKLHISICTIDRKKYTSTQKYSYNELQELIFGSGFFKGVHP